VQTGFTRYKTEHAFYSHSNAGARMIIIVYVDDLLVFGDSMKNIGKFKEEVMQTFSMSDLDSLSYYLGIEVKQTDNGIELYQKAYAAKILDRVGLGECNGAVAHIGAHLKLSKRRTSPLADATAYQSLTHTCLDLCFSVGYLSHFMSESSEDHMAAQTKGFRLKYKRAEGELYLTGYSDMDLTGDIDDHRSTTEVLFFLQGNPVC
jgi:hypothetical protein